MSAMEQRSIDAYDLPQRVESYDADMEVMHPNRSKMVQVALEILPFHRESVLRALDLGIGTGYFTKKLLEHYPNCLVVAVDGAKAMIDLAKERLGASAGKVDFRLGDFRHLKQLVRGAAIFDVVYSSYALHHLNRNDKQAVIGRIFELLRPAGWFLNADIIVAESPEIEQRLQELRINGIVERAASRDTRFRDAPSTRRFLHELAEGDADQPQTLLEDLRILKGAGFRAASVFWLEYREALCGAQKRGA
jgi:tRNA (cmo5U34)-methyltransferase